MEARPGNGIREELEALHVNVMQLRSKGRDQDAGKGRSLTTHFIL